MKHLLSIEAMDAASIETILENATVIKAQRGDSQHQPLAGQTWAMIFTKSSTHTRVVRDWHPRTGRRRDVPQCQ